MRRFGVLLAAIAALAIAAVPLYVSGATPSVCHATAAADCPCHMGDCDISTPPSSACHCPPAAALLPLFVSASGVIQQSGGWDAAMFDRLRSLKTPPPLRPPILI
jgi:hypothetical protein